MAHIRGMDGLLGDIEAMRGRARRARPAMDDAASVALGSVDKSFEAGGRPAWRPHAPATLAKKIGPRRLLDESGDLRGSFEKRAGHSSASVFPTDWKAGFHEFGTRVGGRERVPARPFMHLQPADLPVIGEIILSYVTHG